MEKIYKISLVVSGEKVRLHIDQHQILKEGDKTYRVQMIDRDGYKGRVKMLKKERMYIPGPGIMREDSLKFVYFMCWTLPDRKDEMIVALKEHAAKVIMRRYDSIVKTKEMFEKEMPGFLEQMQSI